MLNVSTILVIKDEYNKPKCGLSSRIQHLECSAGENLPLQIADVDKLKTRLIDEWEQFDQSIVDAAISQLVHEPRPKISCIGTTRGD